MTDEEFLDNLKSEEDKQNEWTAGAEHFVRMKIQTGLRDNRSQEPSLDSELQKQASALGTAAQFVKSQIKNIDPVVAGASALGAGILGGWTYLSSRPRDSLGGKSKDEIKMESKLRGQAGEPEHGLIRKLLNRKSEFEGGAAKALREHPVKASLIGAATGALLGRFVANLAKGKR